MGSIRALFIGLMFALAALPAAAAGKLNMVDTITTASGALDVATYYAPDQSAAQSKVALLGISHKISIAFSPGEWPTLTSLWNRAVAAQSGQWQTIGTFDETGTSDPSVLTVSAGQGVQFVISSPAKGAQTFVFGPGDLDRFGNDLRTVQAYFDNPSAQ